MRYQIIFCVCYSQHEYYLSYCLTNAKVNTRFMDLLDINMFKFSIMIG